MVFFVPDRARFWILKAPDKIPISYYKSVNHIYIHPCYWCEMMNVYITHWWYLVSTSFEVWTRVERTGNFNKKAEAGQTGTRKIGTLDWDQMFGRDRNFWDIDTVSRHIFDFFYFLNTIFFNFTKIIFYFAGLNGEQVWHQIGGVTGVNVQIPIGTNKLNYI